MRRAELTWEDWRAVIALLLEQRLPDMLAHADHIERLSAFRSWMGSAAAGSTTFLLG